MLVLRVLPFVLAASLKNRLLAQLRRLRQPRYALATAVGLGWFWLYAGRHLVAGPARVGTLPEGAAELVAIALAATGTALLALAWVFRARHQALAMSEAEVQFLFPAPLTRVQVLHWRVLQLVAIGFLGTLFTTVVFGRAASGRPLLFALGAWIAFATVDLHRLGIALTWAAVGEGWAGLRRRAGTFAALAAGVAFTAWAATRLELPPAGNLRTFAPALARAVLDSPLGVALWPGLTLAGLVFARTPADFLVHLPGALALLALHYLWVIRSGVAFEEAVVAASERRARLREAWQRRRGGTPQRRGPRKAPFHLESRGPVEVAFVWKALIATGWGRLAGRGGVLVAAAAAALAVWLGTGAPAALARVTGVMLPMLWGFAVVMGPSVFRSDLRLDRANLDVLRALPVSGTRLVRGQLLGAAVQVTAAQWLLLLLAVASTPFAPAGARAWLGLGAAVLGPAVSLVALVLQNAIVVVLPGWVPRENERTGGPEAVGMRLVVAIGGLVALSLVVLPAVVAGGLVLGSWWLVLGAPAPPVLALAACVSAAVLAAEAWLASRALGAAFDRLDPSEG